MTNTYRVRYREGDFEVEVESSDQSYVDAKLREFLESKPESTVAETGKKPRPSKPSRPSRPKVTESDSEDKDGVDGVDIAAIVRSIHEASNFEAIERNAIKQSKRLPRILMCFYFAYKYSESLALTTGDVEQITDQFRVKIAQTNVAKVIREGASKYLSADQVRKRGALMRYKINARGISTFEKIMKGDQTKSDQS